MSKKLDTLQRKLVDSLIVGGTHDEAEEAFRALQNIFDYAESLEQRIEEATTLARGPWPGAAKDRNVAMRETSDRSAAILAALQGKS